MDVLSRILWVIVGLILPAGSGTFLAAQTAGEYEVKAAFLYKFASFVEWPAETAKRPVCIAVVGQDPFGTSLDEVVKDKSIGGRGFVIERFKSGRDAKGCHIVFISASEKSRVRMILEGLKGISILTVSDFAGFCQEGGIVEFQVLDQKVRFQINLDAGERARLKLSSKLLSVAKIVRDGRQ